MEICFIPNNDYAAFIEKHADKSQIIKGEIRSEDGERLGNHDGIHKFTVGQRKGLGVYSSKPLYVTRIDPETGTVFVGGEDYLKRSGFYFSALHLIRPSDLSENFEVKIRYRSPAALGRLTGIEESHSVASQPGVVFCEPQKSITPGQIAVLYRNDEVLGGGFIERIADL